MRSADFFRGVWALAGPGIRSIKSSGGGDQIRRTAPSLREPQDTMTAILSERTRAQRALVEEHVRCENAHDLPGIIATFGHRAWYDDEPWGEHHEGPDAVHGYYKDLLTSLPDLHIDIVHALQPRMASPWKCALAVRTSGPGAVSHLPVDELRFPYADFTRSMRRERLPVSAFTTTGEAC